MTNHEDNVAGDGEGFAEKPLDGELLGDVEAFLAGRRRVVDEDGVIHEEPIVHPWGGMHPPEDKEFGELPYLDAPGLEETAVRLIGAHKRFAFLEECTVRYLWGRKGSTKAGAAILGTCQKRPGGVVGLSVSWDWAIVLAADHIRGMMLTPDQVEAILFHEMCHCALDEKSRPTLREHDWAGFRAEVEVYGLYLPDIRGMEQVFRQLRMKDVAE